VACVALRQTTLATDCAARSGPALSPLPILAGVGRCGCVLCTLNTTGGHATLSIENVATGICAERSEAYALNASILTRMIDHGFSSTGLVRVQGCWAILPRWSQPSSGSSPRLRRAARWWTPWRACACSAPAASAIARTPPGSRPPSRCAQSCRRAQHLALARLVDGQPPSALAAP